VTTSEGYRQAQINEAEGDQQALVLRAQGSADAVEIEAKARAIAIGTISAAINHEGGTTAVAQQLSEQYISAFEKLAREGTVVLLPADASDVTSVVSKAFTAFDALKTQVDKTKQAS
jgi:regulator of protease activity HflC (stomatin/prohibitin superfamily)